MIKLLFCICLSLHFFSVDILAEIKIPASTFGIVEYKEKTADIWKILKSEIALDAVYQVSEKSKIQFKLNSTDIISENYAVFSIDLKKKIMN